MIEPARPRDGGPTAPKSDFFYGWVIVAACTLMLAMYWGVQLSFSIFFKPLIADFGWSRAATSGIYSAFMVSAAVSSIPLGWLADRFGPRKIAMACGLLVGLGLVLASRVSQLWQLYLAFGLMVGTAGGGAFGIGTGLTARWFLKRRGLALGIVSAGVGLGTIVVPPVVERLIDATDWSRAYLTLGTAAWLLLIGTAVLLRGSPEEMGLQPYGADTPPDDNSDHKEIREPTGIALSTALRTRPMWMMMSLFFLFNVSVQLVLVHVVNYATDQGISAFAAATVVSVVGIGSTAGRIIMGSASDRIGSKNAQIICCLGLTVSLVWLVFSTQLWMLYVFALVFSLAYGGEVTQMPMLVGEFYGLRSVMALVGATLAATRAGGALGSWLGGQVFDMTHSYIIAFAITAVAGVLSVMISILLKRLRPIAGTVLDQGR